MSVLILGALGVVIAVSLILLGLGSSKTGLALEQSNQAKALANACAEESLYQIKTSNILNGSGSLSLGQGTCSYSISTSGSLRQITATGVIGTILRKVKIVIDIVSPRIHIASWEEVADF